MNSHTDLIRLSLVLLWRLGTFPVLVSSHQKWIEKPQSVQAFQGESAVISCKVENKVGHCSWRKNGRLVYLYPGKYSWAGNPAAGDCSLRISNLAAQFDTGHWQCSVTASSYLGRIYLRDTLDSLPVLLTVLYPPSHATIRVANDVSGQVVGVAGKSLEVECLGYGGQPPPEITWHLEGRLQPADTTSLDSFTDMETGLVVSRSTISLDITRQDHNKVLSCELLHPALGLPLWVKAMINVGYPPKIAASSSASGPVVLGETGLTLHCQVDANPPAYIVWRKEGSRKIRGNTTDIVFDSVKKEDAGDYYCQAINELGRRSSEVVTIETFYSPSVNVSISKTGPLLENEDDIRLTCDVDANPKPEIAWLKSTPGQEEQVITLNSELFIQGVKRGDAGLYYCVAKNSQGLINKSVELEVYYAPNVTMTASQTTVTEGEDSLQLLCEVDANPPAKVKWIKNLNLPSEEVIGLGPTIEISTVRRGNAGTYNCVATNIVGTSTP